MAPGAAVSGTAMSGAAIGGIRLVREGGVAHVTLDRPDRLNTLDLAATKRLGDLARECAHDSSVRAVLLDGEGRSFCGGGDLKSFAEHRDALPAHLREVTSHLHSALTVLARLNAPVVVAAHGGVAGAGLGLMALGDIVLAAQSAKFVFAYNAIGLVPDGGTSWLLPRLLGPRLTMDLALTNRPLTATEALAAGLVSRVVPDDELAGEAAALAQQLADGPTTSYGMTKKLLTETWSRSYAEQLAAESEAMSIAAATDDGVEGITSFVERRPPTFTGR
jgi:2-(1,2-epoxy-1,2-dihydrophenyl)acetyl-CoA isomerase